jgi:serine/threonine protein kinase
MVSLPLPTLSHEIRNSFPPQSNPTHQQESKVVEKLCRKTRKFKYRQRKRLEHRAAESETMGNGLITNKINKIAVEQYSSSPKRPKKIAASYLFTNDLKSKYSFHSLLAKNATATIFSATCSRTNQPVVIKKIPLLQVINASGDIDSVVTEFQVMKAIQHDFLVKLLYATHEDTICYLVMASLPSGDLRYHLRIGERFPESSVAYIIACVGSALQFLHDHGIIHRDVKPENVVLDQHSRPILIDLGIAYIGNINGALPICSRTSGTLPYIAPETLSPSHRHSCHVDFWSLGVMAYELLFLRHPFDDHCPAAWVYFVANYYESLWDHLEVTFTTHTVSVATSGNANVSSTPPPLSHAHWGSRSLIHYDSRFTHQLSHPAAHLMLNEDGSLPELLQLVIPSPRTSEDMNLSEEGKEMLRGLLDPRVERRLGAGDQKTAFTSHRWLVKHRWCGSLATMTSPLLAESTACFTFGAPLFKPDPREEESSVVGINLTTAMENMLQDYRYDIFGTSGSNDPNKGGVAVVGRSGTMSLTRSRHHHHPRENQLVDVE